MNREERLQAIYDKVDHVEAVLQEVEDWIFEIYRETPGTPLGRTGTNDIAEALYRLGGIHNAVNEEMSYGYMEETQQV